MKITKVTPSQKVEGRFYLDFEGGGSLRVTQTQIADFALYTGRELDDDEYETLRVDAGRSNARSRALRILGTRGMSRRDMVDRLVDKGEDRDIAEETADWLVKNGMIDEAEYARAIVREYARRGYGEVKIRSELYRRKVDADTWDDALAQITGADDKALEFIKSKLRGETPDAATRKKVTDALYRRGFRWDDIRAALQRYSEDIREVD
jgi:regulatory protein